MVYAMYILRETSLRSCRAAVVGSSNLLIFMDVRTPPTVHWGIVKSRCLYKLNRWHLC